MEPERKATDILLSIEELCKDTNSFIKNIDFNYKLILKELRSKNNQPSVAPAMPGVVVNRPSPEAPKVQPAPASPFQSSPDLKSKIQQALEKAKAEQFGTKQAYFDADDEPEFKPAEQLKSIPVTQKITYISDNANVYMATVEIINLEGEVVKQGKTNNSGKWIMPLAPGDYSVRVTKAATPKKPPINIEYGINIPKQVNSFEVETKAV